MTRPRAGDVPSLSDAYEGADTPLFLVAVEGRGRFRFVRINRSFLAATGLSREQVEGKLVQDVIPAPSSSMVIKNYERAVRTGKTVRWEETSVYPAGERCGEVAVTPLKGRGGKVSALSGLVHDVTARKAAQRQARESADMFAKAFHDNPTAMAIRRERDDVLLAVNRSFERLFGWSREELVGRTVGSFGFVPKTEKRRLDALVAAKAATRGLELDAVVKDGDVRHMLMGTDKISVDGAPCLLATFVDLTDRKKAEKALLEISKSSQSRSRQIETLAATLVSTEQRERRRLAGIVHESLQQQLVATAMQLKLLGSSGAGTRHLKRAQEILGEALATTRSLSREINPPAPFQAGFPAVLRWLAEQMRRMHRLEVDLRLAANLPRLPESTQGFLFGAVRELLFNSVKHAKARRARVVVGVKGGELRIQVSDHGMGFDSAKLEQDVAGMGLLTIRESVGVLGGRFEISSRRGEGCRARIVVPLGKK